MHPLVTSLSPLGACLLTTLALLLAPELVLSVMRKVAVNQTKPSMEESAKVMQHGLEVPSHVVCVVQFEGGKTDCCPCNFTHLQNMVITMFKVLP